jgi:hypothetical protein
VAEQDAGEPFALRLLWRGLDEHPIEFANQFVIQSEQDEIILTIGQFQPPILLGEPHERIDQARQLGYVPINVVARYAFTRQRLGELTGYLIEHLRKFDEAHAEAEK